MTTDEDKISNLYQQGKDQAGKDQGDKDQGPPAHLDKAILKAAHEAVEHVSPVDELSIVKGPFSGGWRATVSIAAVLIITVILVPLIEQEEQEPEFNDRVNGHVDESQATLAFKDEIAELELKQLRKEKTKKRVMQDTAKAPPEGVAQLNKFQTFSESDSAEEQAVARQNIAAMRSASPAPATVETSMTTDASDSPQQEAKTELTYQKKQLSQPKVMAFKDPMTEELSPEQWLKNIRQLIEKGDIKTARKELADFRLRYPDEEIEQSILDAIK